MSLTSEQARSMRAKHVRLGPGSTRGGQVASHTVRAKDGGKITLRYGRKLAIRLFCTECLGWEDNPRDCTAPLCPLYPFRGSTLASLRAKNGRAG